MRGVPAMRGCACYEGVCCVTPLVYVILTASYAI